MMFKLYLGEYDHLSCKHIFMILFSLLVTGCGSTVSVEEQLASIFTDSNSLPSWQGIKPEISTEVELVELMDMSSPEEVSDVYHVTSPPPDPFSAVYRWHDKTKSIIVDAWIRDGKVALLEFHPYSAIPLTAITNVLGVPDTYSIEIRYGETPYMMIYFFYETQGIVLRAFIQSKEINSKSFRDCQYQLSSAEVGTIFMAETSSLKETAIQDFSYRPPIIQPWTGFGFVDVEGCE